MLIDKLITCCKEVCDLSVMRCIVSFGRSDVLMQPNAERTQRLFASLRDELEKRGSKLVDGPVGG
jgi:hypothetical protein